MLTTEINPDAVLHFGERYFGTDIWTHSADQRGDTTRTMILLRPAQSTAGVTLNAQPL